MNPLPTRCRLRSLVAERLLIPLLLLLTFPVAWAGPAPVAGTSASATVTGTSPVTMHFPITRSGDNSYPVWLYFHTQNGTAIAGSDYTAAGGATTVPAAATGASIPVQVLGASSYSADKQFSLNLLSATGVGPTATFVAQAGVPVGSLPQSVTTADVNGDGKPDVITANSGSSSISVRLNTTAPGAATTSFAALHNFSVGTKPMSVTAADVNGDGKPDLIVANYDSDTVSLLINTTAPGAATPSFAAQQAFTVGTAPISAATADVNGDGKPDLIVANYDDDTVSVLINTTAPGSTAASFAAQHKFPVEHNPNSVTAADVNGDGKPDLIVANSSNNSLSILLNTTTPGSSTPSFRFQQNVYPFNFPVSVTTADLNGDGKPDLIATGIYTNQAAVFLNTTAPGSAVISFSAPQKLNVGSNPRFVTTADLNGDGKPDLVIVNTNSNSLSLFENTTAPGAATPSFAAQQTLSVGSGPLSATTADLNGDGKPDLIAANSNWSNLSVLLNTTPAPTTGAPSFATQQTFATGSGPYSTTTADVNGDGKSDLITANFYSTSVSVLLNATAPGATIPSFATQQAFTTGGANTISVTAADVNGDGKPDLITANENNNTASVLLNTTVPGAATSSFATQQSFSVGNSPVSDTTADVNGNGKPDLIVSDASGVSVLLNATAPGAATASFAAQQTFPVSSAALVTAADVNGDGKPDLIVANANSVSVLLNATAPGAATASFAALKSFSVGNSPVAVTAADLNGDGKRDLIVTNSVSNTISALLNTTAPGAATASFAAQQTFATGSSPYGVRAADVNGDGKPDLIVSNNKGNTVSVLVNTTTPGSSTLSFAAQKTFATGNGPTSLMTADVNGDGTPDLIVANFSGNTVSVLLNTFYTATVSPANVTGTIHYAIPQATFSPDPLAFGNVLVGTSSTKAVTLTNSGQTSLSISSYALGGTNAARFSQTNNCPASLAIGANCTIQVSYAPNALSTDNAALSVSTNEPNSPDTVALSGTGSDTAPTANNGTLTTSTNTAANGTLSATDPDSGQTLTYSIVTQPVHGSVTITNANTGAYTYTPASGYAGSDSFTFQANDGYKTSNTATVSITVNDNAPTANSGTLTTNTNTAANGTLSATNPDSGQTLTYSIVTQPAHGTVTITNANTGAYTYTPATGYAGNDSFTFKANDGYKDSNVATISVTVNDNAPTANNGTLSTNTNMAANGTLSATNPDSGQTLTYSIVTQPAHGTVSITNANTGAYTYTPNTGYAGSDAFAFKVNDGYLDSNTATISVTVTDTAPTASNSSFSTSINTAYSGQLKASNPDSGQALTYSIVTQPSHGSVSIINAATGAYTYTPSSGYVGADSFTFKANDGYLDSNVATVAVSVNDNAPTANNGSYKTLTNQPFNGQLQATNPDSGQTLTFSIVAQPAHGTVAITNANTGAFTYTPATGYAGNDSFTFKANDGYLDSNTATVSVTVADSPPTAIGASFSTPTNQALSGQLQGNTNDAGQTLTFALGTKPAHGSVTVNANGSFSYTPDSGYAGSDAFTFLVNDGYLNSAPATVSITINDGAPTASNASFSTPVDTAYSGQLKAANPNAGQTLTYSIVSQPSHGTVSITNAATGAYTYTPNTGFIGSDSFTFKANDGYKDSNTATVSASVTDSPPVAQGASYNVTANRYVTGKLKATASSSSQALTYTIVSRPADGTVSLDAGTGQFTYIPTHNYTGPDSFTFKASDGTLDSNSATITLKVAAGGLAAHNGFGGGAFGPWGLALLTGLAGLIVLLRKRARTRASKVVHNATSLSNGAHRCQEELTMSSYNPSSRARYRSHFAGRSLIAVLLLLLAPLVWAAPIAYIANRSSATVSVIDTATNAVTATVPVGSGPFGVAVSPDGSRVYVSNQNDSTVSVIDTATNTVTATVPVGSRPEGVAVSPDGSRVYVGNGLSGTVSVIDTTTNTVSATVTVDHGGPIGVAVNPDGSRVYVVDIYNVISVIDTATNTVTATVPVGSGPFGVAVSPDGSRVYVANACVSNTNCNNGTISVIDATTNAVTATVPIGYNPIGVAVSPDGSRVYVANNCGSSICTNGTVSVFDAATNTVTAIVPVGIHAAGVAVSPDGSRVYVTNNNAVSVIDAATNAVTATVGVGSNPLSLGNFAGPGALIATNSSASGGAGAQISGTVPTLINSTACSPTDALVQSPTQGTVTFAANTGAFTYTPRSATYSGPDAFTWRGVAPGCTAAVAPSTAVSNTATATITLNPLLTGLGNFLIAPGASRQSTFSLTGSTPFTHTLASDNATVLPPAGLTISPAACGTAGNLSCTLGVTAGAVPGTASVTVTATDTYGDPVKKTLLVTVDAAPTASNASYNVTANHYVSGKLKATASSSSQTLTYALVSQPAHGTVSVDAGTGQFTYIPAHNYTGTDSFTFKANDGTFDSNTATITLKVAAGALAAHNGAGGGAFGPGSLALLAVLAILITLLRRSRPQHSQGPLAMKTSTRSTLLAWAIGAIGLSTLLFSATPARAADATGPWYLGVQGNVLKAAGGRNSATAGFKGWTLLFGRHLGQHFALEIDRASYSDYPETLTATANWVNWGLRGLYFPCKSQGAFAPFIFAGVGHQYEYQGDNSELSNNSASLGLGFTSQPWSAPVAIRADIEAQHGFGGGYTDKIFSLGVVFGFGSSK